MIFLIFPSVRNHQQHPLQGNALDSWAHRQAGTSLGFTMEEPRIKISGRHYLTYNVAPDKEYERCSCQCGGPGMYTRLAPWFHLIDLRSEVLSQADFPGEGA